LVAAVDDWHDRAYKDRLAEPAQEISAIWDRVEEWRSEVMA
jgi:hypothetical protein